MGGRGNADCHSQCAHWLRNDTLQEVHRAGRCGHRPLRKRNKRCNGRATARVAPTKALQGVQWAGDRKGRPYEISCRGGRPCPPVGVSGVRYAAGRGQPTLHYIMLLCGAWGRGCKRPFARQQGGGAPRPVGGIFVSYLFRSSKLSAVTMDWTLVHRGAKVLARSS